MRRTLLVIGIGSVFGTGCRTANTCGVYGRPEIPPPPLARAPDCCPVVPTSAGRPVIGRPTGAGWTGDPSFGYPAVPVYPSGVPSVVPPAGAAPPNELPYPTIPSPQLPVGPEAIPSPAVPYGAATLAPPAARTTGETKTGK